jgi:hypothetical protein
MDLHMMLEITTNGRRVQFPSKTSEQSKPKTKSDTSKAVRLYQSIAIFKTTGLYKEKTRKQLF